PEAERCFCGDRDVLLTRDRGACGARTRADGAADQSALPATRERTDEGTGASTATDELNVALLVAGAPTARHACFDVVGFPAYFDRRERQAQQRRRLQVARFPGLNDAPVNPSTLRDHGLSVNDHGRRNAGLEWVATPVLGARYTLIQHDMNHCTRRHRDRLGRLEDLTQQPPGAFRSLGWRGIGIGVRRTAGQYQGKGQEG